ncbi:PREDICTED: protein O-linked-mannose beta-1,4-N-acetylglucosaminyltransferase 2-like [Nelumbo nucifera]|uniref:Glycosyltransferase 61 catalytic domain-containing protein n=2 Tax=Nelumbo nucifera TaxID=4432 RepID=A0A822YIP7_NELNU|nr:PREDICTED: protein O-linked-mannose beta-1,4-N-acetylglucosaminyltransferase 2-like [Nelumbo nucifera]DAD31371.1 TPA_asm: hypothetical protein HUJ06_010222 [Nelumbo nucifera]
MKRGCVTPLIMSICILLFTLLYIHQITISSFISTSSLRRSTPAAEKRLKVETRPRPAAVPSKPAAPATPIICDRSHEPYDLCTLNAPTLMNPNLSTFSLVNDNVNHQDTTSPSPPQRTFEKVRPYPRKWENGIISGIKEITFTSDPSTDSCQIQHHAPALVFSAGGYTGNLFHDFSDGFVPLFLTTRSLFSGVDPVLIVANCRDWWLSKYAELLRSFSPYPVINLDNETAIHCFPSATVGLISQGFMTIDPTLLPNKETFLDFRALLQTAYMHHQHLHVSSPSTARPRLVLVGRTGGVSRVILNQKEVVQLAKKIGFEVVVFKPTRYTSLSEAYKMINASHAMMGVHGAALTHFLFLRPGSVLVQVVPIGIDWLGEICFGKPARDMGLEYMEYKITVDESSLVDEYGKDDLVLRNPEAVIKLAWSNTNIYLKNQNVKLDLIRVGVHLKKAYKKAKRFIEKQG